MEEIEEIMKTTYLKSVRYYVNMQEQEHSRRNTQRLVVNSCKLKITRHAVDSLLSLFDNFLYLNLII